MNENTTDLTEAVPTMDDDTQKTVVKWAVAGASAAATLVAINAGVKKFRAKKTVKVIVADKPLI